jgi:hypothetical protein
LKFDIPLFTTRGHKIYSAVRFGKNLFSEDTGQILFVFRPETSWLAKKDMLLSAPVVTVKKPQNLRLAGRRGPSPGAGPPGNGYFLQQERALWKITNWSCRNI